LLLRCKIKQILSSGHVQTSKQDNSFGEKELAIEEALTPSEQSSINSNAQKH